MTTAIQVIAVIAISVILAFIIEPLLNRWHTRRNNSKN